jgi:serine/threonine protein kinase
VAIKILPEALAQDADRMARFHREAQVLASLNHPNIAVIHGVEERALILELVEGDTLAERIAAGPIPFEEALPIAKQIAEALEYAHERGVIHRDLKPANIKITPDGKVKVLDFGLAAVAQASAAGPADPLSSATLTMRATQIGVIMGTAAYMSPEQVSGKPVHKRADIWSFGVVLWEMLTGRQLFEGKTISHTLADVLRAGIDLGKLPKDTPAATRNLLRRCLDRDIRKRLRDIGEGRIILEEPMEEAAPAPAGTITPRGRAMLPWILAALATVVAAGIAWRATRPADRPLMWLSVDLGPDARAMRDFTAAISPDGTRLVFPIGDAALSGFDPGVRLSGEIFPAAVRIQSLNPYRGAFSTSASGALAYISGVEPSRGLVWVDRTGKELESYDLPGTYRNFRLSPDEKRLVIDRIVESNADIWVVAMVRHVPSRLTSDPATDNLSIWSPDGSRVLFPSNRSGAFDLYVKAASGTGEEQVLVKMGTPSGWATDWSRDGRFILYEIPGRDGGLDLWIAPQFGDRKPFPYLQSQFNEQSGRFSPDGHWIAYVSDESGQNEVYVQAFPLSGEKQQISSGGGTEPQWRADGSELFYVAGDRNLMAVPVKPGGTFQAGVSKALFPIPLSDVPSTRWTYAVSRDGRRVLMSKASDEMNPITVVLNWAAGLPPNLRN